MDEGGKSIVLRRVFKVEVWEAVEEIDEQENVEKEEEEGHPNNQM